MNAALLLIVSLIILACGYIFYGGWLAKTWGIDPSKPTPSHEMEDGQDYCPAKAPVLMGHHFSSIAGAGPINGPIQAAVFGWVPVLLWVLVGGIFFGGVHDFGALFASIRHNGQSIGEIIEDTMGVKAKRLFICFAYLTLLLVIAAFSAIVANTFEATFDPVTGALDKAASAANASTAIISLLFIVMAIIFGFFVYRRNAPVGISTIVGIIGIVAVMVIGLHWHPIYLTNHQWMIIIGIYIAVASIAPVWILLQPRDYLSSFLLYFMIALAVIGIIGSHVTLKIPAFLGFKDTLFADNGYKDGKSLGYLFPALFVTIACGAISGFHSLVSSGTSSKQIDNERDAQPIAFGSMLLECVVAVVSICAVGYVWDQYKTGALINPPKVFATGISQMVASLPGLKNSGTTVFAMLILAVSVFCLTSLDTSTRLARYMFQEFWLEPGEMPKDVKGIKKIIINPYVSTGITVVLGISLGMTGYANIWPLFGAANQLLAALGLLAVATWLGKVGKNNKMFYIPMVFMLLVTITSLCQTLKTNVAGIVAHADNVGWCYIRSVLAFLLVVLAIVLAVGSIKTMIAEAKANKAKKAA
jgi:carbon starvation protein